MASFTKRDGKWEASVCVNNQRRSKVFPTKGKAEAWAEVTEAELSGSFAESHTLKDAFEKYRDEESPKKRGKKWEQNRIDHFLGYAKFSNKPIGAVTVDHWIDWRDSRLKEVQTGSVNREITLFASIYQSAILDWRWITVNPLRLVRRPKNPKPRNQRISDAQVKQLLEALDYTGSGRSVSDRAGMVLLFALETAMRAGEICGLTWENVHEKHVHLPLTKNGHSRDVPLSNRAREIINLLRALGLGDPVFQISGASLDTLFRRARDKANLPDIHFHDSRREATTRLSKKVPVESLAKITGHRDIGLLVRVYYAPHMADLADMLG